MLASGPIAVPAPIATVATELGITRNAVFIAKSRVLSRLRKEMEGLVIPVIISVYADRSFSFILKTPPAADLLRKAAGVEKGAATAGRDKVGSVTRAQVREIAQTKMADLNAADIEAASRVIEGTARSMGIEVVG